MLERVTLTTERGSSFILRRGQVMEAGFGRGGSKLVELAIAHPAERWVSRVAGVVTLDDYTWRVRSGQRSAPLSISHEHGESLLYRGQETSFPWDGATIEVRPRFGRRYVVVVEAQFTGSNSSRPMTTGSVDTDVPGDGGFKQFYALLALCEPRLSEYRSADVPSNGQIAARLKETNLASDATGSKVNRWLADERIRLGVPSVSEEGFGPSFLQDHAIRVGRVQPYHLALLQE